MLAKLLIGVMMVLPLMVHASDDSYRNEIRERIAPVGQVTIEKSTATETVAAPKKVLSPGEQVYKNYCTACHAMGVAGAPKSHNATDWAPRMKKGIDKLMASAIKGIAPGMPPRGTCSDCTDAQIKAAIQYMLPKKS